MIRVYHMLCIMQTFNGETTTQETSDGTIVETMDSRENINLWFSSLIGSIFSDAICGDGQCKGELEGWQPGPRADIGCEADCFKYKYSSMVNFDIAGTIGVQAQSNGNEPKSPPLAQMRFQVRACTSCVVVWLIGSPVER